ncbi:hypothetical protein [Actinomadura fibrosa]|uniref:Uncharacterized protein n=1 Tax=Actinomadura fibrosa TaxID=111802 RepID=A0ABW2XH86_9ACTN|nr:hypothetical protein [Actinomadura fibrosa]
MLPLGRQLDATVVARWVREVRAEAKRSAVGEDRVITTEKARSRYYEIVLRALDSRPPGADHAMIDYSYEDLYRRAGHKSPSTLYFTFGRGAKHALADRLPDETRRAVGASDMVRTVVMELKTLSHWPYRQGWLDALAGTDDRRFAAETLVRVLADWAGANPRLAAHADYMPAASAVEDLGVICGRRTPAADITAFLARVLTTSVGPRATSAADVLDLVHARLMAVLGFDRPGYVLEIVRRLDEPIGEVGYLVSQLRPDDRAAVRAELEARLAALNEVVEEERWA